MKMKEAVRRLFLRFQAASGLILWPGKNHEEKMPGFLRQKKYLSVAPRLRGMPGETTPVRAKAPCAAFFPVAQVLAQGEMVGKAAPEVAAQGVLRRVLVAKVQRKRRMVSFSVAQAGAAARARGLTGACMKKMNQKAVFTPPKPRAGQKCSLSKIFLTVDMRARDIEINSFPYGLSLRRRCLAAFSLALQA